MLQKTIPASRNYYSSRKSHRVSGIWYIYQPPFIADISRVGCAQALGFGKLHGREGDVAHATAIHLAREGDALQYVAIPSRVLICANRAA